MKVRHRLFAAILLTPLSGPAFAAESVYTDLNIDKCAEISTNELGGSFKCDGLKDYPIYFTEGDLRQSVQFGPIRQELIDGLFQSFAPFNYVGNKVEWRVDERGKPYAAILRWYIENSGADGSAPTKATKGQVLVVSRVAQPEDGMGCVIGYIDARANTDANVMARELADDEAVGFACGHQEGLWQGARGEFSGEQTSSWPEGLAAD